MKYKTLILENGVRGGRLKKPLRIRVPEHQNMAEKRLQRYIQELSTLNDTIPISWFLTHKWTPIQIKSWTGRSLAAIEYYVGLVETAKMGKSIRVKAVLKSS